MIFLFFITLLGDSSGKRPRFSVTTTTLYEVSFSDSGGDSDRSPLYNKTHPTVGYKTVPSHSSYAGKKVSLYQKCTFYIYTIFSFSNIYNHRFLGFR